MPTEEIFTAPKRDGVNGVAVASMPLVKDGNVIDGFRMRFENGKIVEVQAEQGEDVLRSAIAVDEGAYYLGEVALVPYDSPIQTRACCFTTRCLMRTPPAISLSARRTPVSTADGNG